MKRYFTGWSLNESSGVYTFEVNFDDDETEEQTIEKLEELGKRLSARPGYRATDPLVMDHKAKAVRARGGDSGPKPVHIHVWFLVDARPAYAVGEEDHCVNEWMLFDLDLERTTLRGLQAFADEVRYGTPLMLADTKGQNGLKQLGVRSDVKVRRSKRGTVTKEGYRGLAIPGFRCRLVSRPAQEIEMRFSKAFWLRLKSSYRDHFSARLLEIAEAAGFDKYIDMQMQGAAKRIDDLSQLVAEKSRKLVTRFDGKEDGYLASEVAQRVSLKLLYEGSTATIDENLVVRMIQEARKDVLSYMRNLSSCSSSEVEQYERESGKFIEGAKYLSLEEVEQGRFDRNNLPVSATAVSGDKEYRRFLRYHDKRKKRKKAANKDGTTPKVKRRPA